MTLRPLKYSDHLPALDPTFVKPIRRPDDSGHAPRILLLYGSLPFNRCKLHLGDAVHRSTGLIGTIRHPQQVSDRVEWKA